MPEPAGRAYGGWNQASAGEGRMDREYHRFRYSVVILHKSDEAWIMRVDVGDESWKDDFFCLHC